MCSAIPCENCTIPFISSFGIVYANSIFSPSLLEFIKSYFINNYQKGKVSHYAVVLKTQNKVIGNVGFNNIYPKQNKELIDEILENRGLILTEYEKDVKAESKKFLERNRIVAGLGIGTLVIEAGYRSGTSVTARYTKNLNKPVFCVPSSLENSKGLGTNELIKNGSKLVTKVEDILIEYPQIKFKKKLLKEREKQVPKELEKVYKCIKNEPANINQIVRKTKMSIQDISYKIMLLQLENLIEELPGQVYRIKNGEDDE